MYKIISMTLLQCVQYNLGKVKPKLDTVMQLEKPAKKENMKKAGNAN